MSPPSSPQQGRPSIVSRRKFIIGVTLFVLLTLGVFGYQFAMIDPIADGPSWEKVNVFFGVLFLLSLPVESLAGGARLWLVCRVLKPGVGLWSCIKAECSNVFFAMLTPSQSGGGPAQIYVLSREGDVEVETAFTISIISFLGTLIGLMLIGLYVLAVGSQRGNALFTAAVWSVVFSVGLAILGVLSPGAFRVALAGPSRWLMRQFNREHRLIDWREPGSEREEKVERLTARLLDMIYTYRHQMIDFTRRGRVVTLGIIAMTLVFLFNRCFVAYLVVRLLGIDVEVSEVLGIQLVLVFTLFFAPTPGSAGIAEGMSLAAMAPIISSSYAPYYNLLWRFGTLYFGALAGALFFSRLFFKDMRRTVNTARDRIRERRSSKSLPRVEPAANERTKDD